jgi:hypothetical protein
MGYIMIDDFVSQSPPSQDWSLSRASDWTLKVCCFPRKCYISGKKLWGKYAYCGTTIITGPGDPVVEHFWIDKDEFLIWNLKGKK